MAQYDFSSHTCYLLVTNGRDLTRYAVSLGQNSTGSVQLREGMKKLGEGVGAQP